MDVQYLLRLVQSHLRRAADLALRLHAGPLSIYGQTVTRIEPRTGMLKFTVRKLCWLLALSPARLVSAQWFASRYDDET